MAAALDLDFALFHKERKKANEIARMVLVGNVEGKTAILIDDMADTCGTLALAAKHLLAGGAKSVFALVTHGILSGPALKVLSESMISKLIVTNSIPQGNHKLGGGGKLKEIDISHVLAEAVRRSHYGESVSALLVLSFFYLDFLASLKLMLFCSTIGSIKFPTLRRVLNRKGPSLSFFDLPDSRTDLYIFMTQTHTTTHTLRFVHVHRNAHVRFLLGHPFFPTHR